MMIEMYVDEFIAIWNFLEDKEQIIKTSKYLAVPRERVEGLLSKHMFDEVPAKLKKWKAFGWIDCDKDRLTRRILIDKQKRQMIVMRADIFKLLNEIQSTKKPKK